MEGRGLYVGRLPVGATDAKLVQAFARFGKIQHILNKYWQGFAFIRFEDASSVDRVLVEPVHMIDGQVLLVEVKSTKEFRIQQKAEEDDASKAERERRRAEGYEEGETAQAAQLREARRAAAEARRLEFDEQRAKRVAEMEAEAEAEAMAVDELPVVKKRTPPKQPRHNTPNQPAGTKRFVFHEAAERQMVTMEGCGGSAFYSIQGKRKGPFSEVKFDADDEGPFMDFDEIDSSIGITTKDVPGLAKYFDEIKIIHNYVSREMAAKLREEEEQIKMLKEQPRQQQQQQQQQPQAVPSSHNPETHVDTHTSSPPTASGTTHTTPAAAPGRGRGRGRGRGQH